MIDDLKYIHSRDSQDALGIAEKQWQQLNYLYTFENLNFEGIQNIVLSGMGGSALPGLFLNSWPKLKVPFEISRSYNVPLYVNENTLFISSSYSGNTEETLSSLADAQTRGAKIVVLSAGGQLSKLAKDNNYPHFVIPSGVQPRMSTFYFIAALAQILEKLDLCIHHHNELTEVAEWLSSEIKSWRADVSAKNNLAKKIAYDLVGKTVIVYSGPLMAPVANKWKIGFNENAKNLAWWNQYPELNHNEFIGWSGQPIDKPFALIEIRSSLENEQIQKRFIVTEKLLSGKRPAPVVVEPSGDTLLKQILWASTLGDFVSIYLALLNNIDPTPVALVEKLKKELGTPSASHQPAA